MVKLQKWLQARVVIIFSKIELRGKVGTQKNLTLAGIRNRTKNAKNSSGRYEKTAKITKKRCIFGHKKGYKRVYVLFSKKSSYGVNFRVERS